MTVAVAVKLGIEREQINESPGGAGQAGKREIKLELST
jgi:hypothetical protein